MAPPHSGGKRFCREVDNGRREAVTTWQVFSAELKKTFSPVDGSKTARDQLRQLRQTKSVPEYTDKFRTLALEIDDLSVAEGLDRYVAGLKSHIREKVEIEDTKTH